MEPIEDSCRLYTCAGCQSLVLICRRCDRGHQYCGKACSSAARRRHHNDSDRRYGQSMKGRFSSATRSRRYRQTHRPEKNVTDQGSEPRASDVPLASDSEVTLERGHSGDVRIVVIPLSGLCTLCRVPIGAWARTGYLRSESKIRIDQRHSHRDHRKRSRRQN